MKLEKYVFLIGLLFTLVLLQPLFLPGLFSHHLDDQILRIEQIDKCLKDFQIPCRWTPDLGGLYGIPLFNYVAPLPYYLGGIFYLITGSLILSYKSTFIIAFISAYIFMYFLAKRFWGKLGGSLSAIFYIFAPYHAITLFVRGDLGQLYSLAILPGLIWSILLLSQNVKILNVLIVALFVNLLILSHNLFALIFLPVILLFVIVFKYQNRNRKLIRYVLIATLAGFLLASFYLIPAFLEIHLIHDPTVDWPNLSYTEHFKGLRKLFLERSWGFGTSIREIPGVQTSDMSFQIGWVHLLSLGLVLINLKRLRSQSKSRFFLIAFVIFMIAFSIFMVHPKSEFLWKIVKALKYLQYPWQFLALVIFLISLTSGSIFYKSEDKKYITKLWIGLIGLAVIFNIAYFRPEKILNLSNNKDILEQNLKDHLIQKTNFETLPIDTKTPPKVLPSEKYEIIWGEANISDFQQGTNWVRFDINASKTTIVRLSQRYFPQWRVFDSGKEIEINPRNELGLITFSLDPGPHKIEVRLYDSPVRTAANLMSLIGVIVFILMIMTQFKTTKTWLLYYAKALKV